jgi:ribosome-associated protein
MKGKSLSTPVLSRVRKSPAAKPPVAKSPAAASSTRPSAEDTLKLILSSVDDMKAEETVTIDLHGKSSIADYMVVTTGRVNRHVGSIAENVVKDLHKAGIKSVHVEGMPNCDWVLIDAGDVVVHVFRPEVRDFYNIEKMWTPGRAAKRAN